MKQVADGFGQRDKYRMARAAFVAGVQFAAPQIEQRKGLRGVAHFVAQIVGDAAVGVDGVKMRTQRLGQKPRGHVEVLVVRLGQLLAPGASLFKRGRHIGNAIIGGQRGPAARMSASRSLACLSGCIAAVAIIFSPSELLCCGPQLSPGLKPGFDFTAFTAPTKSHPDTTC